MCTLFILICLACTYFVYCSSSTTPEPLTTNPSESTYITFAVQWKPQFCYKNTAPNCHNELIPNITIHGIWPNAYTGSHPWYCSGPELQHKDIELIENALDIYWPTLVSGKTNFDFWSYEWDKHGTCWTIVNATQYFTASLIWMENEGYNEIQYILASNDIYASNDELYSLKDVTNALNTGLNQEIVVRCKNGKYIIEFFVCRDWSGKNKIDCPETIRSNCNDEVILSLQVLPYTTTTTRAMYTSRKVNSTVYANNLMVMNQVEYDNSYRIQMFLLICFIIIAAWVMGGKFKQYTQRYGYKEIKTMHHSVVMG
eukprot:276564_1